jgi:hypothetical protein
MVIMSGKKFVAELERSRNIGLDQGIGLVLAEVVRQGYSELAKSMMGSMGFRTLVDLKNVDPYDNESLIPLLDR